jgi:hypothetical protein
MVFGSEAILPADVALKGPRVEHYDEKNSNWARLNDVNRLTCVRMAKYLDGLRRYRNHNVNDRFFVVRDLVLHKK